MHALGHSVWPIARTASAIRPARATTASEFNDSAGTSVPGLLAAVSS